jgi:hypothetical protein
VSSETKFFFNVIDCFCFVFCTKKKKKEREGKNKRGDTTECNKHDPGVRMNSHGARKSPFFPEIFVSSSLVPLI